MTSDASPAGYQPGDRVILITTTDPYTRLAPGARGIVTGSDYRHGQIHIAWDDGSTLSMLPAEGDQIRRIRPGGAQPADA